jgi:hypothetical protein
MRRKNPEQTPATIDVRPAKGQVRVWKRLFAVARIETSPVPKRSNEAGSGVSEISGTPVILAPSPEARYPGHFPPTPPSELQLIVPGPGVPVYPPNISNWVTPPPIFAIVQCTQISVWHSNAAPTGTSVKSRKKSVRSAAGSAGWYTNITENEVLNGSDNGFELAGDPSAGPA